MVNKFKEINWRPERAERRKFALTLMAGFPCMGIGLTLILRLTTGAWNFQTPLWVVGIGEAVAVFCLVFPGLALPFYRAWFFLICIIDTIVTTIVLTILFYGVMFPAGLPYRMFRAGSFSKKPKASADSYWQDVPAPPEASRYYRQY
jgi:hypothetical protein